MYRFTLGVLATIGVCCPTGAAQAPQCPFTISDTFNRPDGTPLDSAVWANGADCSQASVLTDIENGTLTQSSCLIDTSCAFGCFGTMTYTQATFLSFDMSIRYAGTTGNDSGGFGVLGTAFLPPSPTLCNGTPNIAIAYVGWSAPGGLITLHPQYSGGEIPTNIAIQVGDVLRLVGSPGQSLDFYVNGAPVASAPNWNIGSDFVAFMSSQEPLSPGACHSTQWDDFSGSFAEQPAVQSLSVSSGDSKGGTPVSINGHGLGCATSVSFGSESGTILSAGPNQIQVLAPPAPVCDTAEDPVDVCVTSPGGTTCLAGAWTWLPHLSVAATWQPSSTVTLTIDASTSGSMYVVFVSGSLLPCPGIPAPPSARHFLLAPPVVYIATISSAFGTLSGTLPASWPGVPLYVQAAEAPAQGTLFQLTNVGS